MKDSPGRGLEALIPKKKSKGLSFSLSVSGGKVPAKKESVFLIEIENIKPNPYQPRRDFAKEELAGLAESIKEFGVLQPLIVTKAEKETPFGTRVEYQLIAGERRLRAAKLAGLMSVPVVIRSVDDARNLEVSLVENIQREDLNALERAEAFQKLIDEFNLTQRDIALKIGKSREAVANTLRLLELSSEIKELVRANKISEGHARALIGIKGKSDRRSIIEKILGEQLNVRQVEELARKIKKPVAALAFKKDEQIAQWEVMLEKTLGITVRIRKQGDAYAIEFKNRRDTEAFFSHISRR